MLSASRKSCKPLSRLCAKVSNPPFDISKCSFSTSGAFSEKNAFRSNIFSKNYKTSDDNNTVTLIKSSPPYNTFNRGFSSTGVFSKKKDDLKSGITVTRDGSAIVCWHPEEPFPYECSKPLPEEKLAEVSSVLKIQSKAEVMSVFKEKPREFITEELCKLTFTSKHTWAPRQRDKRAKKTPPDREWL